MQTERDDDRRYQFARRDITMTAYLRMRVHNRMQWSVLRRLLFRRPLRLYLLRYRILLVQLWTPQDLLEPPGTIPTTEVPA